MLDRRIEIRDLYVTPEAAKLLTKLELKQALDRHARCDWGRAGLLQSVENERNLKGFGWKTSVFQSTSGREFVVQTKRQTVVALMP